LTHLLLAAALHLEAERQLTERREGHGIGDLDEPVPFGEGDLLVPQGHGNWREGWKERRGEEG